MNIRKAGILALYLSNVMRRTVDDDLGECDVCRKTGHSSNTARLFAIVFRSRRHLVCPPLGRVLDAPQSPTSGQRGRVRMLQLGGDVTPAHVDGDIRGRVAADGDAAEGSRLVFRIDEVVAANELLTQVSRVIV